MKAAWSRVSVTGPLAPYVDGFAEELAAKGYAESTVAEHVRLIAHLSWWMANQSLETGDLTPARMEQFVQVRTDRLMHRPLEPLLGYLRGMRLVPTPVPATPTLSVMGGLLGGYRRYLLDERGLVETTIRDYERRAGVFVSQRASSSEFPFEGLTAAEINHFVVRECERRSIGSVKCVTKALRSLLRFAFVAGLTTTDWSTAVPAVASWQASALPRALDAPRVALLVESCDRRTGIGRRDYAILHLLARLGLRAGEVAGLNLDDVSWRRGEFLIRGKGRRQDHLPLPIDVGEAVCDYLSHGRPRVACRRLFLRARAPIGGLTVAAIECIVRLACVRAGVPPVGPHRLRHTAATEMLRHGASLLEIGQVLRHRSQATTAIYAKVDRSALRGLAQAWPGGDA
jgi:integrase/recombinase XerD